MRGWSVVLTTGRGASSHGALRRAAGSTQLDLTTKSLRRLQAPMQAIAAWAGGYRTVLDDGRTHQVTVDLPRDEGGESAGTSPLELCVLSLAGCVTTIFALVARKRRLAFSSMTLGLEAERTPGSATIARVRGTLRLRTEASEEEVDTTLRLTVRTCPVGVLFERAGIPVELRPVVERPVHGATSRSTP